MSDPVSRGFIYKTNFRIYRCAWGRFLVLGSLVLGFSCWEQIAFFLVLSKLLLLKFG